MTSFVNEWRLNDDGRWEAVDPGDALAELGERARAMTARNREALQRSRELAESVRRRCRARAVWRALTRQYPLQ